MISNAQILLRLFIAAILGGAVGLERERHHQPAGLRTHTILAVGSALAMYLSILLAMEFRALVPNGDPARLAAQVISGIGFLGAGAILRYGINVRGLTTATSFWSVAIVGLAVGSGHFFAATAATVLILATLEVLDYVEKHVFARLAFRTISLKAKDRPRLVEEVKQAFSSLNIETKSVNVSKDLEANEIEIAIIAKIPATQDVDKLVAILSRIEGAKEFDVQ